MNKSPKPSCETCPSRLLGVLCTLEGPELKELDRHKTTNTYQKGQVILYEGNKPYGIFCIFSGRVKLYKTGIDGRQQIVRITGPGDMMGYRALLADEPYNATAEAIDDSVICCVDKDAFFHTLAKDPDLTRNLFKKLAKELGKAEQLATSIAQKSVRERMAELLLMLKETYGKPVKAGTKIGLSLSREEMAEMIGVTQETAIRLLSEFKKDGMIDVQDREVTILNIKALLDTARIES